VQGAVGQVTRWVIQQQAGSGFSEEDIKWSQQCSDVLRRCQRCVQGVSKQPCHVVQLQIDRGMCRVRSVSICAAGTGVGCLYPSLCFTV
jgi:hypothetical protein